MADRIRVTIEHFSGGNYTSHARNLDLVDIPAEVRSRIDPIIDRLLDDVAAIPGIPRAEAAATVLALLVERICEDEIYVRVAADRGVLAL